MFIATHDTDGVLIRIPYELDEVEQALERARSKRIAELAEVLGELT